MFEPKIITSLHDLAKWLLERTNRFPRNWRITLGDKIDKTAIELLIQAQKAAMTKQKMKHLISISENLEVLRILIRLSHELGCLEPKQYEFAARQMVEIGKQLGGWIKQQESKG
jgi:hypothetical protein